MTKADQDQEYVLGTKQLLSAFFVVMVLLGVFFTAGYVIGRNTGPKPAPVSDASANASPATEAALRTANHTATERTTDPMPTPEREPAATHTLPVASETQTEPAHPAAPSIPAAATQPKPVASSEESTASQVAPGHLYLQLMAVKRPVAEDMVKLLKGRGYPALIGESSKPELFRVLVGPFPDMPTLAKTKTGLKSSGFESVVAK